MPVLVVVEHDSHTLKDITLQTVMAACHISMYFDGQIHLLVAGYQVQGVQEQVAGISGVSKVLVAEAPQLDYGMTDNVAAQVLASATPDLYSHILLAASRTGSQIAQRIAGQLGVAAIERIRRVAGPDCFACAGQPENARVWAKSSAVTQVITVCAPAFEAAACEGGIGTVERLRPGIHTPLGASLHGRYTASPQWAQ